MKRKDKLQEISTHNKKQLSDKINEAAEELMKARFKKAVGQLGNTNVLKTLKRDIARLKFFYNKA